MLVVLLAAVVAVTLLLTAFGDSGGKPASLVTPDALVSDSAPEPVLVATAGNLRVQLPVARASLTKIGFHSSVSGALELTPHGRQANEGLLVRLWRRIAGSSKEGIEWVQLGGVAGPGTNVLAVGAPEGSDVFAPVDGRIAAISDFVLSGKVVGSRIDIRPTAAPSVILSITHVRPDPLLTVGSPVLAATSRLGLVVDVAAFETQSLARYTNDEGNNVSIEVHPAATLLP